VHQGSHFAQAFPFLPFFPVFLVDSGTPATDDTFGSSAVLIVDTTVADTDADAGVGQTAAAAALSSMNGFKSFS